MLIVKKGDVIKRVDHNIAAHMVKWDGYCFVPKSEFKEAELKKKKTPAH